MNAIALRTPPDSLLLGAANVLVHITVVTTIAILAARLVRRCPVLRYGVLALGLGFVLLSPALVCLVQSAGYGLIRYSLTGADSATSAASKTTLTPLEYGPVPGIFWDSEDAHSSEPGPESGTGPVSPNGRVLADSRLLQGENTQSAPSTADSSSGNEGTLSVAETPASFSLSGAAFRTLLHVWMPPVLAIWIAGAILILARLAVGWYRLAKLLHAAKPVTNPAWNEILRQVLSDLRVRRVPRLLQSPQTTGPASTGLFQTAIILPDQLAKQLTDDPLRAILVHEVAHLLRRDQAIVLLQNLASSIFWLHPLVGMLNRQLARAREEVCDNFVLLHNDPSTYGRTLLELACLIQKPKALPGTVGLFTSHWKLDDRVAGLLDARRSRMIQLSRGGRALVALLGGLLLIIGICGTVTPVLGQVPQVRNSETEETGDEQAAEESVDAAPVSPFTDDMGRSGNSDVASDITGATPMTDVTGIVRDDGAPVANAVVQIWYFAWMGRGWRGHTTAHFMTDSSGRFSVPIPRRRLSGLRVFASTPNGSRMALESLSPALDQQFADVRLWMNDPARLPDLELNLTPAIGREVLVVDSDGTSVPGATVGVYILLDWKFMKVVTDDAGKALVHVPADTGQYDIFAFKHGYAVDYKYLGSDKRGLDLPADDPSLPVTLKLDQSAKLRVHVIDTDTKLPLPDVKVATSLPNKPSIRVVSTGEREGYGISAVTDSQGVATIDWLPEWIVTGPRPDGIAKDSITVWTRRAGYSHSRHQIEFGAGKDQFTISVAANRHLHGHVKHTDGRPATGIAVASWTTAIEAFDRTITDEDGNYELAVPPGFEALVAVNDDTWGAAPQRKFEPDDAGLSARVPDIVLTPAKRVFGNMMNYDTKYPVVGQQVWLEWYGPPSGTAKWPTSSIPRESPHASLTTWTDEAGNYEFHVGPGVFDLIVPKDLEVTGAAQTAWGFAHWSLNIRESVTARQEDFEVPTHRENELLQSHPVRRP